MEARLAIYRAGRAGEGPLGTLGAAGEFAYSDAYLADPSAQPISRSLPLMAGEYGREQAMPYFEGLVPEGDARRVMAAELHVREDDYLAMLGACGLDCVGDLVVAPGESPRDCAWKPVSREELARALARPERLAGLNRASRLSLAGTQGKVGLAHVSGAPLVDGWMRPVGRAASTHILKVSSRDDISYFELLCMRAAHACGVRAAGTHLLGLDVPVVCSERFDRRAHMGPNGLEVARLHQEDLAQALGLTSGSKYAELEGGTVRAVARLLAREAERPSADLEALVRLLCFDYLIGNCDNHLKNLSLLYSDDWAAFSLAPAYDLVCTTWFPEYSRDMGMALGGVRGIDAVGTDEVRALAAETGTSPRLVRRVSHELADAIGDAVWGACEGASDEFDELGWKAEELLDDLAPRRAVLAAT